MKPVPIFLYCILLLFAFSEAVQVEYELATIGSDVSNEVYTSDVETQKDYKFAYFDQMYDEKGYLAYAKIYPLGCSSNGLIECNNNKITIYNSCDSFRQPVEERPCYLPSCRCSLGDSLPKEFVQLDAYESSNCKGDPNHLVIAKPNTCFLSSNNTSMFWSFSSEGITMIEYSDNNCSSRTYRAPLEYDECVHGGVRYYYVAHRLDIYRDYGYAVFNQMFDKYGALAFAEVYTLGCSPKRERFIVYVDSKIIVYNTCSGYQQPAEYLDCNMYSSCKYQGNYPSDFAVMKVFRTYECDVDLKEFMIMKQDTCILTGPNSCTYLEVYSNGVTIKGYEGTNCRAERQQTIDDYRFYECTKSDRKSVV